MEKICKNCKYKLGDACRHPHGLKVIVESCYCCYFSEGRQMEEKELLNNDHPDAQIPLEPIDLFN